jgi:hypothetical protein
MKMPHIAVLAVILLAALALAPSAAAAPVGVRVTPGGRVVGFGDNVVGQLVDKGQWSRKRRFMGWPPPSSVLLALRGLIRVNTSRHYS